jgi:hypothetical protein
MFIFVVPPVLMILVGGLRVKSDRIATRVLMHPTLTESQREDIEKMFKLFGRMDLSFGEDRFEDPLKILRNNRLDLLVVAGKERLTYYTSETDQDRVYYLRQQVASLEAIRKHGIEFLFKEGGDRVFESPLIVFFSVPQGKDLFAVPRLTAIIVCFFPFLLASGTIIQERDEHTLEPLLVSLKSRWSQLMLGKALLPFFIGLFNFLVMVLIAESAFGLNLKSGFLSIIAIQAISIITSLLIGLSISCIVSSSLYALIASALYLLCLILLTGFIFPLETASPIIRILSRFFPLTFTLNPTATWIFGGTQLRYHLKEIGFLMPQMLIYLALAVWMVKQLKKHV